MHKHLKQCFAEISYDENSIDDSVFDLTIEDDADEVVDTETTPSPPSPQPSTSSATPTTEYKWEKVVNRDNDDCANPELDEFPEFTGQHSVEGFEGLSLPNVSNKKFLDTENDLLQQETDRYAKQGLDKLGKLPARSRYRQYKGVQAADIKTFVAIEIGMGLVHKPTLES
ncbi:hypothetical protein SK128_006801 [Halocaridina rubra]|uniref:Uncharacterized protein n=1 Tax=Halocaridina rubra TaxID=373956 RepID=A0AAN9AC76_HALRR